MNQTPRTLHLAATLPGLVLALGVSLGGAISTGATPAMMNYQGFLSDSAGTPRTGQFSMVFGLYPDSTGGAPLWSESHAAVSTSLGVFNVLLGSVVPIPQGSFEGARLWLETSVAGTVFPRRSLVSVPYAFRAAVADSAVHVPIAGGESLWSASGGDVYRATGNVGIGTAMPLNKLYLVAGDNQGIGVDCGANSVVMTPRNTGQGLSPLLDLINGGPSGKRNIIMSTTRGLEFNDVSENSATIFRTNLGTERLRIDAAGNVGIGTAAPADRLAVSGKLRLGDHATAPADYGVLKIKKSDNAYNGIWIERSQDHSALDLNVGDLGASITTDGSGGSPALPLTFGIAGVHSDMLSLATDGNVAIGADSYRRLTVDTQGDVGIGLGAVPAEYPLHVRENVPGPHVVAQFENADGSDGTDVESIVEITNGAWNGGLQLYFNRDSSAAYIQNTQAGDIRVLTNRAHGAGEVARFRSDGNVGIGTTSPQARLDVDGTARMTGFRMPTGAAAGRVLVSDATGTGTWQAPPSGGGIGGGGTSGRIAKFTDASTIGNSVISESGDNVGIGTASPSAKLEVAGTTKTTGFQMSTGATANAVLTSSNAAGDAVWQAVPKSAFLVRLTTPGTPAGWDETGGFDLASEFTTGTPGYFTAQRTGQYQVNAVVYFASAGGTGVGIVELRKNGATMHHSRVAVSSGYAESCALTVITNLMAGDRLDIGLSGSATPASNNMQYSYWSCALVHAGN